LKLAVLAATALVALTSAPPPQRMQVVAKEFSLTLSRGTLHPGPVIVQLVNYGEDAHDLRLRRNAPGSRVYAIPPVQSGGDASIRLTLKTGTYLLWCSLANHRELGMWATLKVTS
jgi:hypothetical protein